MSSVGIIIVYSPCARKVFVPCRAVFAACFRNKRFFITTSAFIVRYVSGFMLVAALLNLTNVANNDIILLTNARKEII